MTRVAVVGHVEWVEFARVERVPAPGQIVHALESWEEPGGGGGVAAVQLARMAGTCTFFTALGDDETGDRALARLRELGVSVHATRRAEPTRRAFTHTDAAGERTITVIGDRMVPFGSDALPWQELADMDAVYLTAGDPLAVRAARAAGVLVATPRAADAVAAASIDLDALVYSGGDPDELAWAARLGAPAIPTGRGAAGAAGGAGLLPRPRYAVATAGAAGGTWTAVDGTTGTWSAAAPPGPIVDAFGCGDSFAAGLTLALGSGAPLARALEHAAHCGAACLTGRGPYGALPPRQQE